MSPSGVFELDLRGPFDTLSNYLQNASDLGGRRDAHNGRNRSYRQSIEASHPALLSRGGELSFASFRTTRVELPRRRVPGRSRSGSWDRSGMRSLRFGAG